jgi:hypothetical protein
MSELGKLVIHVGRAEIEFFDLSMLWTCLADPYLAIALVHGGGQYPVAVRADASGLSDLFSLGPFYLDGFRINHRIW